MAIPVSTYIASHAANNPAILALCNSTLRQSGIERAKNVKDLSAKLRQLESDKIAEW